MQISPAKRPITFFALFIIFAALTTQRGLAMGKTTPPKNRFTDEKPLLLQKNRLPIRSNIVH